MGASEDLAEKRAMSAAATTLKRDATVISLVGVAHLTSHLFQFVLPPIFPLLREEFGVSYSALGLVVAAFYGASGVGQAFIGVFVDRHGGKPVLVAGLALLSGAVGAMAFAPGYWTLLPLALIAGLGNSVFHPADFSILTHSVSERWHGRAFSIHAFSGTLGYALSPVLLSTIAYATSWRIALSAAAAWGLAITLAVMASGRLLEGRPAPAKSGDGLVIVPGFLKLLRMPAMFLAFFYLTLIALAATGLQTYAAAALTTIYAVPYTVATGAISAYLIGNAAGILAGGPLADMSRRHEAIAMLGLFGGAALMSFVAMGGYDFALVLAAMAAAGFSVGTTTPARDMLVKSAAPRGATGKTFGLVYSGFDIGSMIAPLILGWLVDHGMAQGFLLALAAVWLVTIAAIGQFKQRIPVAQS